MARLSRFMGGNLLNSDAWYTRGWTTSRLSFPLFVLLVLATSEFEDALPIYITYHVHSKFDFVNIFLTVLFRYNNIMDAFRKLLGQMTITTEIYHLHHSFSKGRWLCCVAIVCLLTQCIQPRLATLLGLGSSSSRDPYSLCQTCRFSGATLGNITRSWPAMICQP